MHFRIPLAAILITATSCSSSSDRRSARQQDDVGEDRRWIEATYDTLWQVGGRDTDTLLGYPSRITTLGSLVVFSDPGFHRVVALQSADGSLAWSSGGRIDGENLHHKPLILAGVGHDTIAVVDDRLGRVSLIGKNGRLLTAIDLPPNRRINGICPLRRGGAMVASTDAAGPLYWMHLRSLAVRRVLLVTPELVQTHPLLLQSELTARHDGRACAVALSFGNWLALTDGDSIIRTTRYREAVTFPRLDSVTTRRSTGDDIEESTQYRMSGNVRTAALDVSGVEGRIRVLFGGRTPDAGRIIDDYDDRTLEYVGSVRLPFRATNFTTPAPDIIVLLTERRGFPMIMALRQHATKQQ